MSATQLSFSWSSVGLSQNNFLWCLSFWGICAFLHLATIDHFLSQCLIPLQSAVCQRHQTASPTGSLDEGWSTKIQPSGVFGFLQVWWRRTGLIFIGHFNPSEAHIAFMFWTKICNLKSKRCFSKYLVHAAFKSQPSARMARAVASLAGLNWSCSCKSHGRTLHLEQGGCWLPSRQCPGKLEAAVLLLVQWKAAK